MDRGVWKAATDRNTDNCVYNWDGDRKTVKFATTNAVKFRTAHEVINTIIFFYISNEGVSLLENAGHLGLPIPEKLKDILAQLHDRAENGKGDE